MNILMILANPFTKDPRVYNEARSFIEKGHSVTVLAWDEKKENPAIEIKDGIRIVRSYNSKFMNILPYDILKLYFWWKKGYKDSLQLFEEISFDVIHCHDLNTLPIGFKLKEKTNLPLIYDAHEIFGYMVASDLPQVAVNYFFRLEKKLCKNVDRIITVNILVKKYFQKLSNVPINIVMNAKPVFDKKYDPPKNKIFTIKYIGRIDKTRKLIELVEIVKDIERIKCIIAGGGHDGKYVNKLKKKCENISNCEFIGIVPMENVIPETKKADIIYCLEDLTPRKIKWPVDINLPIRFGLANKVFESMVAGRPIVVAKDTYNGMFIEKVGCGIVIESSNKKLKDTIIKLRDNPKFCEKLGKKGFNAAKEKYNWERQFRNLLEVYEQIYKR